MNNCGGCMDNTRIVIVSNVFIKQILLDAGEVFEGHEHPHDHVTLLAAGAVELTVRGKTTTFKAPRMMLISAGVIHGMRATEEDTVLYCIHALRTGDRVEDVLDPAMIPAGVKPETIAKPVHGRRKTDG